MFLRLNAGSLPLSPQELRQALHPGPFIDFTDEFSIKSNSIKKVLNIENPDYRMRDIELVIRYFSFKRFIYDYTGNLKKFFDDTVEVLNANWDEEYVEIENEANELNNAIEFTFQIWGDNAFRKWKGNKYQGRFNRAIFDIMVYYFSIPGIRTACQEHAEEIIKEFENLSDNDVEFLNSFETSTKNIIPTEKRYSTWGRALAKICDRRIVIPTLRVNE